MGNYRPFKQNHIINLIFSWFVKPILNVWWHAVLYVLFNFQYRKIYGTSWSENGKSKCFHGNGCCEKVFIIFTRTNKSFNLSTQFKNSLYRRPVLTDRNPHIEVRIFLSIRLQTLTFKFNFIKTYRAFKTSTNASISLPRWTKTNICPATWIKTYCLW